MAATREIVHLGGWGSMRLAEKPYENSACDIMIDLQGTIRV